MATNSELKPIWNPFTKRYVGQKVDADHSFETIMKQLRPTANSLLDQLVAEGKMSREERDTYWCSEAHHEE